MIRDAIISMEENVLVGIAMMLSGGSLNPNIARAHIARVRDVADWQSDQGNGDLALMEGNLETGAYREQSGYPRPCDITFALTRMASQENCDGDPYEAMIFAAGYIERLRQRIRELEASAEERPDVSE